jgi:putative tryptophan/tyrosine transport system substrate-binding protein
MFGMRRRDFITLLGGAAAAWPFAARAQQAAMPVIGLLGASSADLWAGPLRAIRQGLHETGYVEARNLAIEYRWAEGENDRLPGLASDLVHRQVSVIIVPLSTPGALAAKSATTSIPVVFQVGSDPVAIGLVASLNRPGGNLTGVAVLNAELGPKRLELLRELVPTATVIGCLLNPTSPVLAEATSRELEVAARSFGLRLHVLHASSERDFDAVFATLVQLRAGGLVIGPDALFTSRSAQLAALALRHAVPTVYQFQDFAANGGLLSYGGSFINGARQLGVYCGRILKGERPSDLPVEQSTKVELIINLGTAKAFGLTVPPSLLARADEVIE